MARYAYIRVSTGKQTYDRQIHDFNKYFDRMGMSWDGVEIVTEKITSHTSFKERQLYPILKKAQEGDIIYVCQLDRLGRTMVDILELVDYAAKKGIILLTIDNGYQLENNTAMGKLYLGMVSAMAEAERELRAERCQAGIDAATEEIKRNGHRITKRGTIQEHWGNRKGCDMSAARDEAARVKQERAIAMRESSKAVNFIRRKTAEGWGVIQITEELGNLYDENKPSDSKVLNPYGTPKGFKPSKGYVSKIRRESNPLTLA